MKEYNIMEVMDMSRKELIAIIALDSYERHWVDRGKTARDVYGIACHTWKNARKAWIFRRAVDVLARNHLLWNVEGNKKVSLLSTARYVEYLLPMNYGWDDE